VIVSKLRALLTDSGIDDAHTLTGAFGCYRLDLPEGTWVDVVVAANAAREAEEALAAGDLKQAKAAAALAESLVRQPFLPGEDGTWVEEKRRELTDVRDRALNALADVCLRSGEPQEAVKWAEQTVALAPFRETGYRRLMEAHAAAGNRAGHFVCTSAYDGFSQRSSEPTRHPRSSRSTAAFSKLLLPTMVRRPHPTRRRPTRTPLRIVNARRRRATPPRRPRHGEDCVWEWQSQRSCALRRRSLQ
jgi:DNA-binding SARP family transcriptional activator